MSKIIVRVPNWIGDAVLSTPALHLLKEKFPDSHIAVLAKEWVAPVFTANPDVGEIHTMREGESRLALAGKLKAAKFDRGLLFPNSFSSAFLFWLAGIPRRIGYATDGRSLLLSQRINRSPHFREEHQVDYYRKLVEAIDGKPDDPSYPHLVGASRMERGGCLVWRVTEEERTRAEKLLREAGVSPGYELIGINPGATFGPAKRWFPDRFAKLADELQKRYRAKIIIFGSSGERGIADSIKKAMMGSPPINLAGRTNLRELAAIISRCRLFVTNDTGNMHIAAAVGTLVVAIFGSTNPRRSAPWGNGHILIQKKIECSPCMKKICPRQHYQCLKIIGAEDVLRAIEPKLPKIFPHLRSEDFGKWQDKDGKTHKEMAL